MLAIIYGNVEWYGYVSVVVSIPLVLFTGFFYVKSWSQRSFTGLMSFTAGLISLSSSILSLATDKATFVTFVLFSAYSSCVHLTLLYAFDRLSEKKTYCKYLVYFGYFWSFVTVITGLALTIILREIQLDDQYYATRIESLFGFLSISRWVYILMIWVLFFCLYRKLSMVSRMSVLACGVLITTSSVCVIVSGFIGIHSDGSAIVFYILTNITIVASLLIASFYGSGWLKDAENVPVNIESNTA